MDVSRNAKRILRSAIGDGLICICPEYDELTSAMGSWIRRVAGLRGRKTVALLGADGTRDNVLSALLIAEGRKPTIVFYGHGDESTWHTKDSWGAELDSPAQGRNKLCGWKSLAGIGPCRIIAFCCSSAAELGMAVWAACPESEYVGFSRDVPFLIRTASQRSSFESPVAEFAEDVLGTHSASMDQVLHLKQAYCRERDRWERGDARHKSRALLMGMCLDMHAEYISRIGG